jgi:hypothetical protein
MLVRIPDHTALECPARDQAWFKRIEHADRNDEESEHHLLHHKYTSTHRA